MTEHEADEYVCERVRHALALDERVGELDVHVAIVADKVFITGAVPTPDRRDAVGAVAHELVPDRDVHNDVVVSPVLSDRGEEHP